MIKIEKYLRKNLVFKRIEQSICIFKSTKYQFLASN